MPYYYEDIAGYIIHILKTEWSLGPEKTPVFTFEAESAMANTRNYGEIFAYELNSSNGISTTDYQTWRKIKYGAVRVRSRWRGNALDMANEVYRIVMKHRRDSPAGFEFVEITGERGINPNMLGYYAITLDLKFTINAKDIRMSGFDNH